jgi:hypothetical protein
MSRFSKPKTPQDFVSGSAFERSLADPEPQTMPEPVAAAQPAPPAPPAQELNPRVMKQLNFDLPETEHHALKVLVASMPNMSVRKFIVAAIREKTERVKGGG